MLLAAQHALWPLAMVALFYVWMVLLAWRPRLWLFAVPALLPVLNFSPWNGWLLAEEFDLFLMATLAGAYAAMALKPAQEPLADTVKVSGHYQNSRRTQRTNVLLLAIALLALVSCGRGLVADGATLQSWASGWNLLQTQGYTEPLNSFRSAKSLLWALLFVPLLREQLRQKTDYASTQLGYGMLAGLGVVVVVIVWERAAFPGLFNFSTHYRTTALFWEMHTGGAALDVYLVLCLPFAFWAVGRARHPLAWVAAGLLLVGACYAVLTTFSRGVYGAALLPLGLLGLVRWLDKTGWGHWLRSFWQDSARPVWRRRGQWFLATVLLLELFGVLLGGSYMRNRLDESADDLTQRVAHWQRGLSLLGSPGAEPFNWLFGIGLGRLPAAYAASPGASGWAGQARLGGHGDGKNHLTLTGPSRDADLAGLFAVNQRVGVWEPGNYRVLLQIRVTKATRLLFKLCEKHQIYEGNCYYSHFTLQPPPNPDTAKGWQKLAVRLQALESSGLIQEPNAMARPAVLSVSVLSLNGTADLALVRLQKGKGPELTQNSDFAHKMAFWMQGAGSYYLPWHIDNLLLELLIERGILQLLLFGLLGGLALRALWALARSQAPSGAKPLAPFMACALVSVVLLGLVSSVLDVPRLSFLVWMLILWALAWGENVSRLNPLAVDKLKIPGKVDAMAPHCQ